MKLTLARADEDELILRRRDPDALQSKGDGRILATLENGEQLYISRRYAAALRRALLAAPSI